MKKCLFCKSDFAPKNPKGKFCSDKCRVYFGRHKVGIVAEKQTESQTVTPQKEPGEIDRSEIYRQIEAIQAEKIPPQRDTPLGRASWKVEQQKRINELQKQLS